MPTPIFICGAECGIAAAGTASAGTEHWSTVTAGVTIDTGTVISPGLRSYKFVGSASQPAVTHTLAAATAVLVARFKVRFSTLPTVVAPHLIRLVSGGPAAVVAYESASGKFTFLAGAAIGDVVVTGRWYTIEVRIDMSANPWTLDTTIDGVTYTQQTTAQPASTVSSVVFGLANANNSGTMFIDDIILSATSADYPIGEGTCVGLYPNGDYTNNVASGTGNGGHVYDLVTDFGKGSGGATNLGAQNVEATAWQSLANPLSTSIATNFIADRTGTSAEQLVFTFPAILDLSVFNGLMLVAATHSASATANNFGLTLVGPGLANIGTAGVSLDLSESTITVPCTMGVSIDSSYLRAGTVQALFTSSDVNPDVYLDGVCLEVDYVPKLARHSPYPQLLAH